MQPPSLTPPVPATRAVPTDPGAASDTAFGAVTGPTRQRLAELLVSAAVELAEAPTTPPPWRLIGVSVTQGRIHLAPYRRWLPASSDLAVAVSFEGVCWLGDASDEPPMGRHVHRTRTQFDPRSRVMLDRSVRLWLAVSDVSRFDVIPVPAERGLFLVPVDDFDRRWKDHSDVAG
jgi:hypothetical protein